MKELKAEKAMKEKEKNEIVTKKKERNSINMFGSVVSQKSDKSSLKDFK